MRLRVLIVVVGVAAVGGIALQGNPAASPPSRQHAGHLPYTTAEILDYLLFAKGRVVAEHPALRQPAVITATSLSAAQAHAVSESFSGCIHSIDAAAGPALSSAFNAADPQRLDSALQRVDGAANRWFAAVHKQDDPCPPPPPPPSVQPRPMPVKVKGPVAAYYVVVGTDFYIVGVTLGAAVAVTEVLLAFQMAAVYLWLVPDFVSYEFDNGPTDFDRQTAIAKIVEALRS